MKFPSPKLEKKEKEREKEITDTKIWLFKHFNIIYFVLYHFCDYTVYLLH